MECIGRMARFQCVLAILPCLIWGRILGMWMPQAIMIGHYDRVCPEAESIVREAVRKGIAHNRGVAAGLLRLHFHDCFVRGCDASVLLDSKPGTVEAEKDSPVNIGLHGFEVIDAAKSKLESICPMTVSCADILAFAARDSVHMLGGPFWPVGGGRRDGWISRSQEVLENLPSPFFNVKQLTRSFNSKGLSRQDMITLSGAHTIGVARCFSFDFRLYNFSRSNPVDPNMEKSLVKKLKRRCPQRGNRKNVSREDGVVELDHSSPHRFDRSYYVNLWKERGLLYSDQVLFTDPSTQFEVRRNAFFDNWFSRFSESMTKLGSVEVKTGDDGEIRVNCHFVNA